MSLLDGNEGEMDDFHDLDERELERLLAGHAPRPDLEPLAALLGELQSAYTVEIDQETVTRHVAMAAEAARLAPTPVLETGPRPVSRFRRTRRRLATMLSTLFSSLAVKIATASLAAAAVAGAGAAAGGHLPDDLQSAVAEAASQVGITLPDPSGDTDTEQLESDGFQTGGDNAVQNADEEAQDVVGEIFESESPEDIDSGAVSDTASDDSDVVDDPTSLDDDPTGNRRAGESNRP